MVEEILCQLDMLVLVVVSEQRIRLLEGDQLLESLLHRCVNFVVSSGGVDSLPA